MLEARIVSPRGSLYFAAEATPYDLENLRLHVSALAPDRDASEVRLDVTVDGAAATPALARWLRRLAEAGVRVRGMPVGTTSPMGAQAYFPRLHTSSSRLWR
jgi:hypothetical protein